MEINQFLHIMDKLKTFKSKMIREGIDLKEQSIILKIYLSEITDRINVDMVRF